MNNFGNILRNGFRRRSDAAHHNEARTALHVAVDLAIAAAPIHALTILILAVFSQLRQSPEGPRSDGGLGHNERDQRQNQNFDESHFPISVC